MGFKDVLQLVGVIPFLVGVGLFPLFIIAVALMMKKLIVDKTEESEE
jgi:hypothetical protein